MNDAIDEWIAKTAAQRGVYRPEESPEISREDWTPPTESAGIQRSSKLLQHDCDMTGGLTFEEIEDPPKSQTLCRARLKSEVDPVKAQTVINYVRSNGVFVCLGFYPESIMVTVGRFDNSEPPSPPFCAKDILDAARGIYSYCVTHEWIERDSRIGSMIYENENK